MKNCPESAKKLNEQIDEYVSNMENGIFVICPGKSPKDEIDEIKAILEQKATICLDCIDDQRKKNEKVDKCIRKERDLVLLQDVTRVAKKHEDEEKFSKIDFNKLIKKF